VCGKRAEDGQGGEMHGDAEAVRTTRALTDDRHIAQGHVVEHALAHGRDLVGYREHPTSGLQSGPS
jgi:hypothetical protein